MPRNDSLSVEQQADALASTLQAIRAQCDGVQLCIDAVAERVAERLAAENAEIAKATNRVMSAIERESRRQREQIAGVEFDLDVAARSTITEDAARVSSVSSSMYVSPDDPRYASVPDDLEYSGMTYNRTLNAGTWVSLAEIWLREHAAELAEPEPGPEQPYQPEYTWYLLELGTPGSGEVHRTLYDVPAVGRNIEPPPTPDGAGYTYSGTLGWIPYPSSPPITEDGPGYAELINSTTLPPEPIHTIPIPPLPPGGYVEESFLPVMPDGGDGVFVISTPTEPTEPPPPPPPVGRPADALPASECCPFPVDWDQPAALLYSGIASKWLAAASEMIGVPPGRVVASMDDLNAMERKYESRERKPGEESLPYTWRLPPKGQ